MTDAWTDELVEDFGPAATRIAAPVSRLVVDVQRFEQDADEPMATRGMGVVYERLSSGEPLRVRDPMERARLLERWYRPHHARLTEAVDAALAAHGHCLIIDVHSFAPIPLPHEPDQEPNRPEICLGSDPFHSPFQEAATALAACQDQGFSAALNRPFAGSIVPMRHWGKTREVRLMMIEEPRAENSEICTQVHSAIAELAPHTPRDPNHTADRHLGRLTRVVGLFETRRHGLIA